MNVHPTKKEVHFLYEDTLLEVLHRQLAQTLRSSNESRNFQVQTTLRFDRELVAPAAGSSGALAGALSLPTEGQLMVGVSGGIAGALDPTRAAAAGKSVYASEYSALAVAAMTAPRASIGDTVVDDDGEGEDNIVAGSVGTATVAVASASTSVEASGLARALRQSHTSAEEGGVDSSACEEGHTFAAQEWYPQAVETVQEAVHLAPMATREATLGRRSTFLLDEEEEAEFDFAQEKSHSYLIRPPARTAERCLPQRLSSDLEETVEESFEAMEDAMEGSSASFAWSEPRVRAGAANLLTYTHGGSGASSNAVAKDHIVPLVVGGGEGRRGGTAASTGAGSSSGGGGSVAPQKLVRVDPTLVKINTIFKPAASVVSTGVPAGAGRVYPYREDEVDEDNGEQMCVCPATAEDAQQHGEDGETLLESEEGLLGSVSDGAVGVKRLQDEEDTEGVFCGTTLAGMGPAAMASMGATQSSCVCCGLERTSKRRRRTPAEDATGGNAGLADGPSADSSAAPVARVKLPQLVETRCQYTSVRGLIDEVKAARSSELELMLKAHTFVGIIDSVFSLIQHGTRLMVIDHSNLLHDLMYQLILRRFGELDAYALSTPVPLHALLRAGLEQPVGLFVGQSDRAGVRTEESIPAMVELLCSKAPLLDEYYSIGIDVDAAMLTGLPAVLVGHSPAPEALPAFLWALCQKVNWQHETECFRTVALCLADLYSHLSAISPLVATKDEPASEAGVDRSGAAFPPLSPESSETLRTLLYPALRLYLIPHRARSKDHTVVQVAALEQLYKVFERC